MCNDSVPIDLEGTMVLPEIPERVLVSEYLDDRQIDREIEGSKDRYMKNMKNHKM